MKDEKREKTPLQAYFDALDDALYETRSEYHVTLGKLIEALSKLNDNQTVVFSDGTKPISNVYSYRGHYRDLAIDYQDAEGGSYDTIDFTPAGVLLDYLKHILNTEFTGWKGGEFLMGEDTPLWRASEGDCGDAIVDMYIDTHEDKDEFVLQVKKLG